jgi:putative alpha-1,2-mannosidase
MLTVVIGFGSEFGALLGFNTSSTESAVLLVRTGVSFISMDQACSNAQNEIPTFDFDGIAASARESWNEVLGHVNVELGNGTDQEDMRELLYSSVCIPLQIAACADQCSALSNTHCACRPYAHFLLNRHIITDRHRSDGRKSSLELYRAIL